MTQSMSHMAKASQIETIITRLRAIEDKIPNINVQSSHGTSESAESADIPSQESLKLRQSLERLCSLVTQDAGTARDEEAEAVLDDISALLDSIAMLQSESTTLNKGKKKAEESFTSLTPRDLKRIRGLVNTHSVIDINPGRKSTAFHQGQSND